MLDAGSLPINVRITPIWHDIRKSQNQLLGPMIDSANAFTSPSYCSNNDPNNPRQTFIHPRGLFFFKAFVEHFYQSIPYARWEPCGHGATTPDSRSSSRRESFAPGHFVFLSPPAHAAAKPRNSFALATSASHFFNCSGVRKRSTAARSSVR